MTAAEGNDDWTQQVKAIIREELKPLQQSLQEAQHSHPSSPSGGQPEMPIYKCKGKDCGYATDDIGDFIDHKIGERLPKPAEVEPAESETMPKRHATAEDYLNCPDCFPKFEKAFLARGYKKAEKPAEKPEGRLEL